MANEAGVQKESSPLKGYIIVGFMCLILVGFFTSIYKFRLGAIEHNIPVRDISDLFYILIASLINLVRIPFLTSFRLLDRFLITSSPVRSSSRSRPSNCLTRNSESKKARSKAKMRSFTPLLS
jgi:hypothetical protein